MALRLTLRTLLAWLDDALPPDAVAEIGRRVSESPYAQQMVERIRKVTRQRRLTAPPVAGADVALDANTVAEYLDNVLPEDQVPEVEKVCLQEDIYLAEVAACHQILSLIGQRAKVPAEARQRMYQIIGGNPTRPALRVQDREVGAWEEPMAPAGRGPAFEPRSWVPALVLALVVLFLVGGLYAMFHQKRPVAGPGHPLALAPAAAPRGGLAGPLERAPAPPRPSGAAEIPPPPKPIASSTTKPADQRPAGPNAGAVPGAEAAPLRPRPALPPPPEPLPGAAGPGALALNPSGPAPRPGLTTSPLVAGDLEGTYISKFGVLVRSNPSQKQWIRLPVKAPISGGDRLVNLPGSSAELAFGPARVEMIGRVSVSGQRPEVTPNADLSLESSIKSETSDLTGVALSLGSGRVILSSRQGPAVFRLDFLGRRQSWIIRLPDARTTAGVQVTNPWVAGRESQAVEPEVEIWLYVPAGSAELTVDNQTKTIPGPAKLGVSTIRGNLPSGAAMPAWVVHEPEDLGDLSPRARHTASELETAAVRLAAVLRRGESVRQRLLELATAGPGGGAEQPTSELRQLAVLALAAIGEVRAVANQLNSTDNDLRARAIWVLRNLMDSSTEEARQVHQGLANALPDPDSAQAAFLLLEGYSRAEADEPRSDVYAKLVRLLSPDQAIGIRELAIDNLRRLTTGKTFAYKADAPGPPALTAWKEWLRKRQRS